MFDRVLSTPLYPQVFYRIAVQKTFHKVHKEASTSRVPFFAKRCIKCERIRVFTDPYSCIFHAAKLQAQTLFWALFFYINAVLPVKTIRSSCSKAAKHIPEISINFFLVTNLGVALYQAIIVLLRTVKGLVFTSRFP